MKITIIGWYGTETIGDRAILAGLFCLFKKSFSNFEVRLGCINPLLSERTLSEDYTFLCSCASNGRLKIGLFDSRLKEELNDALKWCDIIVIGGGPLMEIDEMYMLKYAFIQGKKLKKRTLTLGCGFGPFKTKNMEELGRQIVSLSDVVIMRDEMSHSSCSDTISNVNTSAIDPAVFAAFHYLQNEPSSKSVTDNGLISINFREPTNEYIHNNTEVDKFFIELITNIQSKFDYQISLVPMHTYFFGGDDRECLNKYKRMLSNSAKVHVHNVPLSLVETMRQYRHSMACFGMRFHSVLLQTILNGNNYILDYTDPEKGKTISLIKQLGLCDYYNNGRYYSLISQQGYIDIEKIPQKRFIELDSKIQNFENIYLNALMSIKI